MLIQVSVTILVIIFVLVVATIIYHQFMLFLFKQEIKKTDPDMHPIVKLGHSIYIGTGDALDEMGVFERIKTFNKELKSSFPTGICELDNCYDRLKKAEKIMVITFIALLCYLPVFVIVAILTSK
ncbi:MAG: hypothetical protein ACIAQZ_03725 [Sedimentisphaeraceae bacterium JB056]